MNARGLDPDDALASLSVQPTATDVPPGEAAELRATARAKGTRLFGAAQRFPFSVELTEKGSKPEPIQAVFEQRAILPAWILVAAGILVALVVFLLGSGILNPPAETQGPGQATSQPTDGTRTEVPGGETQAPANTPTVPTPTPVPTPDMRTVGDYRCTLLALAQAQIVNYGFALGSVSGPDDPASIVVAQDPAPGSVRLVGTQIDLTVVAAPAEACPA